MGIEQQIKDHMEYTEDPPPKCRDCVFMRSNEDVAGTAYYFCHLNPAVIFPVKESGRCKHFKKFLHNFGYDNLNTQKS